MYSEKLRVREQEIEYKGILFNTFVRMIDAPIEYMPSQLYKIAVELREMDVFDDKTFPFVVFGDEYTSTVHVVIAQSWSTKWYTTQENQMDYSTGKI